MTTRMLIGLLLAAMVLGACVGAGGPGGSSPGGTNPRATTPGSTTPTIATLAGRTFLSTSVTVGGADHQLVAGTTIRLVFSGEGRLGAQAGCNTMGGTYQLVGRTLALKDAATTEMGCEPDRMAQDTWLFGLLGASPTLDLAGDTLTLTAGGTVITLLDRLVVEPDLPLTGRTWTLESLVGGQAVSSVPAGVVATLEFTADGQVTVSTGCNSGIGRVTVGQATLRISDLALTKKACVGAATEVEAALLALLRTTEITYTIDSSVLSLRVGDTGLDFRA